MLPIPFTPSRRLYEASLTGLTLLLLLGGGVVGRLEAGPLPAWGVDDFRALIDPNRLPNDSRRELVFPEPAVAAQNLAEYRRRLQKAAEELPSLGEVSRVLLMSEWSSGEIGFGLDEPVPLDRVRRAVLQKDDEAFKNDVQRLMREHSDNPREVNSVTVTEIKRVVRLKLLDRLENRTRFYLNEGRNVDRVAAANLISNIMTTSRRQDISQFRTESGEIIPGVMAPKSQDISRGSRFRQRLRSLSGDLEKLVANSDTQVRVAAIRALSDLEREPGELVARLKPLLASEQSDAPTRRAAAEALGHVLEVYTTNMVKSRPFPYLKAVEQVLPAAAEGLSDSDPLVRRAAQESCQRAALVMEELATAPLAATDRRNVFRPTLAVALAVLPKLNAAARDRVPELRVGASHVLETFALTVQRMNYEGPPLPPPDIDRNLPMPQPNKEPGNYKKQTSLPPSRSVREKARAVTLERPTALPDGSAARTSRPAPSLIQTASFRAVQLDELPPPVRVKDGGIQGTVQTMIENLKHADYRVRLAAVDTLETFSNQAAAAIPALVTALRDSNKFVRWSSARTLGRLNPRQADEVVPGLMRLLDDREDPSVRIAAAKALELYGEHAKKAVPLLARVINRGDKEYIMAILTTIQGIGTDAAPALPNVAWILNDRTQPPSVRMEAAKTLGRFGALAKGQLPALREVMNNDPDEEVRHAASLAVLAVDRPEK